MTALHHALSTKAISSVELTTAYFNRIRDFAQLNAFITVDESLALAQAKQADALIHSGLGSPLTGIPMGHKVIFCTTSLKTTCGSKMLEEFESPYDATVVADLSALGAVMIGKTNMDEFAMGSTNESSFFGPVKNPWSHDCVPGGSSGGSAAAVAAELCAFATGSDTGGSVRQPAAFCGVSGLKPTYELISRYGMIAYASSLDTAGFIANDVSDLAILLQHVARFDEKDSTSIKPPLVNYRERCNAPLNQLKIGLPRCFLHDDVEPAIQDAVLAATHQFEKMGALIIEIDLATFSHWVPCHYILVCAEDLSNLSRFDGIRFGYRTPHFDSLRELITQSREEGFGDELTTEHIEFLLSDPATYLYYTTVKAKSGAPGKLIVNWLKGAYAAALNLQGKTFDNPLSQPMP